MIFIKKYIPTRVIAACKCLFYGMPRKSPRSEILTDWNFGMTAPDDQRFFREAAASMKNHKGAIIDLGCWMGSTSISLAKGCADANIPNRVRAYDLFRWESWMDKNLAHTFCDYRPGESFLPEVRRRVQKFSQTIELIEADLCSYKYVKEPIKILLVDAMKSNELATAICVEFYPCLLPNSLLIHQDYKHYCTPWIHILQYRLRDYFEKYHVVDNGDTAAFRLKKVISRDIALSVSTMADVSDAEVEAAFSYSCDLVENFHISSIAAAHVMHYTHRKNMEMARAIFQRYSSKGIIKEPDLKYLHDFSPQIFASFSQV